MIRRDADRLVVSGALTNTTVAGVLDEGRAAIGAGAQAIDLSGVTEVDSAAVALILDWTRTAKRPLALAGAPASFSNLAKLYGLEDLLSGKRA